MKISSGYTRTRLFHQTYLLPYGQNIADFKKGMQLNESGLLIWEALCDGKTEDALLPLLAAHYEADEADEAQLRGDIAQFLGQLRMHGIIDRAAPSFYFPSGNFRTFRIGTVTMGFAFEAACIAEAFLPFESEEKDADLTVSLRFDTPPAHPVGTVLVRSNDFLAMEAADCYCLLFPGAKSIVECHIDKDVHFACFYCRDTDRGTCAEELFHGIRFVYLMQARAHGLYAIHSASLVYRGKAWLFSGVSGTGKTTHTNLWKERYGVPLLNGDLNLLGIRDGKPFAFGLPWCGTSGISTTEALPLGGVIFLRQAPADTARSIQEDTAQLMLSQRLITPAWTQEMLLDNLGFCRSILPGITAFVMECTKDVHAAEVCRAAIDERSENPETASRRNTKE